MTAFQEFSAPVLSEFSKIMRDFEATKSGLNKVVLVNGVPSDATHYDTFGGKTTYHRIDKPATQLFEEFKKHDPFGEVA